MEVSVSNSTTLLLLTLTFLLLPLSSKPALDYSSLVYKTCATNHQLSQSHSQTLSSLFQQLIAQSSQTKFFRTTELLGDDTAISGLFQCREDMTAADCSSCVNSLPGILSNTLCAESTSARVQLEVCYIKYETEDLISEATDKSERNNYNLLHKYCGEASDAHLEMRELMEEAFVALQSGILKGDGFFRTNYKSVELMAQCEGDLDACECSGCVSDAVGMAKEECAGSLSAQIYLDRCFISYVYHSESGASSNNSTKMLAAIVVGGAAALFVGFLFLSLLNSRFKKQDYE